MSIQSKISVSGGFGIVMAVLLFFDTQNILPWAILSCALHEAGHILAIHLLNGRVKLFRLTVVGAEIVPKRDKMFSYGEEIMIAMAGPAVSVGLAILVALWAGTCGTELAYLLVGLNCGIGLFNLVPAMPLDGGRIVKALISAHGTLFQAEKVCFWLTNLLAIVLLPVSLYLVWKGNFTLLLAVVWLLAGNTRSYSGILG